MFALLLLGIFLVIVVWKIIGKKSERRKRRSFIISYEKYNINSFNQFTMIVYNRY